MTGFEKGFFSVGSDGSVNCVPQLPTAQNIFKQLFQMQDKQTDRHEMAPVSGSDQSVYPDLTGSIQVDPDLNPSDASIRRNIRLYGGSNSAKRQRLRRERC